MTQRQVQQQSRAIQRAACREYIRQRVEGLRREQRRESVAEIRAALRECGIEVAR